MTVSGVCGTATSTPVTVTVNSPPVTPTISASGPTTFCQGQNVTLTSSSSSGNTWSTGATTQSITVSTAGSYSVTVSGICGTATSSSVTVVVNSPPATPTISQLNSDLVSSSVINNQWYAGSTIIVGETNQNFTPNQSGWYSVTVTDSNGCSSSSLQYYFVSTGVLVVNWNSSFSVEVYPNPVLEEKMTIVFHSRKAEVVHLKLIDELGRETITIGDQFVNGDLSISVAIDHLAPGIYFLDVLSASGNMVKKVLKE